MAEKKLFPQSMEVGHQVAKDLKLGQIVKYEINGVKGECRIVGLFTIGSLDNREWGRTGVRMEFEK